MMTPAKFHLLLVEDEPSDALLVKHAISASKILTEFHHVRDGREALEFLEAAYAPGSNVAKPELILLDLNMPRMDGREFLTEIRADARFKTIPVVVLTTSTIERDVEQAYCLGANSFITKPVEVDDLFAAIGMVSEYWFSVVRLPHGGGHA